MLERLVCARERLLAEAVASYCRAGHVVGKVAGVGNGCLGQRSARLSAFRIGIGIGTLSISHSPGSHLQTSGAGAGPRRRAVASQAGLQGRDCTPSRAPLSAFAQLECWTAGAGAIALVLRETAERPSRRRWCSSRVFVWAFVYRPTIQTSRLLPARSRNLALRLARGRGSPPLRFASTRGPPSSTTTSQMFVARARRRVGSGSERAAASF